MFKDIMTIFVEHGNLFGVMTIMALIIGYFKYLKPFLEDFDGVKTHLHVVTADHKELDNKLIKVENTINTKHDVVIHRMEENDKVNASAHEKIKIEMLTELSKIGYRLDETTKRVVESDNRNTTAHREVAIDLTRIQSRLDYMSPSGARGLQK